MKFFVLLLSIFALSCVSQHKVMDSWMGLSKRDLILKWGPPQRVASDGGEGEILIYSTQTYNPYNNITVYNYKMLYADDNGRLYHWRTESGYVPPQQINMTLYVR